MLKVSNLRVSNPGSSDFAVVNQVSFSLAAGEILAIIGPNGAGKSSLLKALSGEWASDGVIEFEGLVDDATQRARQLAVLPQMNSLNFPFRVSEVVALGRMPHATGQAMDQKIVEQALELMDVTYLSERLYTELSGGEKQRVQIARVLAQIWRAGDAANGARVLLLDEPTTALDMRHQQDLLSAVSQFAEQGVSVVIVMHDVNLAARYANRLMALQCSELLAFGTAKEVVTASLINRLFGVNSNIIEHPETGKPMILPQ